MFFSTNTGIGLSLLRTQIQPPTTTNAVAFASTTEIGLMQLAHALRRQHLEHALESASILQG